MSKNDMSPPRAIFKTAIGIVFAFCCVPIIGYSQSGEIHGLIQALEDKNVKLRRRAVRELEKVGPSAVEPLIAALKSEKSRAPAGAAEALGGIKDTRAVDPLIAALQDNISNVRAEAAEALGKIQDSRAVEPLIAALKDKNEDVRNSAARALAKIRPASRLRPVAEIMTFALSSFYTGRSMTRWRIDYPARFGPPSKFQVTRVIQ